MSVEEATIHHFLLSSSASATTLLPGHDKPSPQVRIGAPHRMSKRVPELSNPAPHASYCEGVGYWELHGSAHRVSVVRLGLT